MIKRFVCLAVVAAFAGSLTAVAADKKPAPKNTQVSPPWQPVTTSPARPPVKNSPDSAGKGPRLQREPRTSPAATDGPGTVYAVLDQKVCVEWEDEPLENVMDWLREQGAINVVVMWKTLADAAVDKQTPISLELCEVPITDVLAEVCQQLSPAGGIGFEASGNLIRIATQEYFDSILYIKVYEVPDLAIEKPDFGFGGGCLVYEWDGKDYVNSGYSSEGYSIPRHLLLLELADQIRMTIAQGHWEKDGGPYSITIDRWRWNLIIKAPISVHEQIGGPFYR